MTRNIIGPLLLAAAIALLVVGAVVAVDKAFGEDLREWSIRAVTECENNIPYENADVLATDNYFSTGMTAVDMDTNGDGEVDVTALYNDEDQPALFWIVDLDHDGWADRVYIDLFGAGDCDNIKLYCEMGKQNCPEQGPMDWRT